MPIDNRLTRLFHTQPKNLLSVYFTAGYPTLESVLDIAHELELAGVDFLEIGFPYSDPIADGPIIQKSSKKAIENGMNIKVLFDLLSSVRETVQIPLLLMGYINPVLQFGMEAFLKIASEIGIDGIILPDLPIIEYERQYQKIFEKYNLSNIFMVSPQSSEERIRKIDQLSEGFIYLLTSSSTTGQTSSLKNTTADYLKKIKGMGLTNPIMAGFGISNSAAFHSVSEFTSGAVVGTAFIRAQNEGKSVFDFVREIRGLS